MSLTDDLYRDIILEHFKSPRNPGRLERPTLTSHGTNPFCGDELELTLDLRDGLVRDIRVESKGCSISQASASMMSEAVKGRRVEEAEGLGQRFKATMLHNAPLDVPPELEDLQALEGVKKYPVRIKCAILSWNTLLEGIAAYRAGSHEASHVESEEGEREEPAAAPGPGGGAGEAGLEGRAGTVSLAEGEGRARPPQERGASLGRRAYGEARPPSGPAGPAAGAGTPDEQVRTTLKGVIDPELNLNVVDLGLIYGIEIQGGRVKVAYTLTSPGCPLGPVIKGQMQSALGKLPWVKEIQADLVWQPPWDPRTMASEEIKTELGLW